MMGDFLTLSFYLTRKLYQLKSFAFDIAFYCSQAGRVTRALMPHLQVQWLLKRCCQTCTEVCGVLSLKPCPAC